MSSEYRAICISHQPAIITDWPRDEHDLTMIMQHVRDRTGPAAGHPNCDLAIGRWSGALVELCCTGTRSMTNVHPGMHRDDLWTEARWLKLLALSTPEAAKTAGMWCWTRDIAVGLADELGVAPATEDPL